MHVAFKREIFHLRKTLLKYNWTVLHPCWTGPKELCQPLNKDDYVRMIRVWKWLGVPRLAGKLIAVQCPLTVNLILTY